MTRTLVISSALVVVFALAGCGGDAMEAPGQPDAGAGGVGGAAGGGSTQHLTFTKDGAPVAVDFSKWGTPAYYQKTAAGWTLAVVANEVTGAEARYFSLTLRATDDAELAPGTYPCATPADGPKVLGQMTWAEANMARVWKQSADGACAITIDGIGPVGGRLQGKFSATLRATKGDAADVVVADGVFDVKRKEY